MQTDVSDEHHEKTSAPNCKSFDPNSNVTVERALHPLKQAAPTTSTEDGIQIESSDRHLENAYWPIRVSRDAESNVTVESPLHS
jgi:hypothetical protein